MHYSKLETYSFVMPEEHSAYLKFKQDLQDSSIRFTETGGMRHQIIEIHTTGSFDKTGSKED